MKTDTMMVRVGLNKDERRRLRMLALARGTSVSAMLTRAARRILAGAKENNSPLPVAGNDDDADTA